MRFIVMHKVDAKMEVGGPPDANIVRDMGALVGGSIKERTFLDGAGLHRSALRVRVRFTGGQCTTTKGPYQGDNELVASLAMIRVKSMDEAIECAGRFARVLGDGEIEIGPVVEAWDIGHGLKPATIENSRFLLLRKGDPAFEAGAPAVSAELAKLMDELRAAGVLLSSETLTPSSKGRRLAFGAGGKRSWTDGPFAESKELIAGFSILELPSLDHAVAWAERYAAILVDSEVDVRPLQ